MSSPTSGRLRLLAVASTTVLTILGTSVGAGAATTHVARKPRPPVFATVVYDVSGSSFIARPKSTVALGPTTLTVSLNLSDDTFTGVLPIPPTTSTFNILGLLPVSATVTFIPDGGVSGALHVAENATTATATAAYYLQLSNVSVAGLKAPVGPSCRTTSPVAIDPATAAGATFNPFTGGVLSATYSIGKFAECGLTTLLINELVPGAGNTASLTVSNGVLQGASPSP